MAHTLLTFPSIISLDNKHTPGENALAFWSKLSLTNQKKNILSTSYSGNCQCLQPISNFSFHSCPFREGDSPNLLRSSFGHLKGKGDALDTKGNFR
jgi:hypothetical protein